MSQATIPKVSILQFPGSNCDQDCRLALKELWDVDAQLIWYRQDLPMDSDLVVIPGGFSFGDYLRAGGLAAISQVLEQVRAYAQKGGCVVGICNGFQILTEARLLPGALLPNAHGRFVCRPQTLKLMTKRSEWTQHMPEISDIPIAHADGRYFADAETLEQLWQNDQVLFSYQQNPNGSLEDIAGITDPKGRVIGLMPHPERAIRTELGHSGDGRQFWKSVKELCLQ